MVVHLPKAALPAASSWRLTIGKRYDVGDNAGVSRCASLACMVSSSTVTHTLNAFELLPSRGDSALRDSADTPPASELLCYRPRLRQRPAGLMVKASVSGGDQLKILGSTPRPIVFWNFSLIRFIIE